MKWFLDFINNSVYGLQAIDALWGAYCVIMIYSRLGQKRFKSEKKQNEFLDQLEQPLLAGDFDSAAIMVGGQQ